MKKGRERERIERWRTSKANSWGLIIKRQGNKSCSTTNQDWRVDSRMTDRFYIYSISMDRNMRAWELHFKSDRASTISLRPYFSLSFCLSFLPKPSCLPEIFVPASVLLAPRFFFLLCPLRCDEFRRRRDGMICSANHDILYILAHDSANKNSSILIQCVCECIMIERERERENHILFRGALNIQLSVSSVYI